MRVPFRGPGAAPRMNSSIRVVNTLAAVLPSAVRYPITAQLLWPSSALVRRSSASCAVRKGTDSRVVGALHAQQSTSSHPPLAVRSVLQASATATAVDSSRCCSQQTGITYSVGKQHSAGLPHHTPGDSSHSQAGPSLDHLLVQQQQQQLQHTSNMASLQPPRQQIIEGPALNTDNQPGIGIQVRAVSQPAIGEALPGPHSAAATATEVAVSSNAAGPAAAAVSGSGKGSSRGRGWGRRGGVSVRSRVESREFVMGLLAKNQAEDAAAEALAATTGAAAMAGPVARPAVESAAAAADATMPAAQKRSKRKTPDPAAPPVLPASAVVGMGSPDVSIGIPAAAAAAAGSDFASMLAELAEAAAPAAAIAHNIKPPKRARGKATAAAAARDAAGSASATPIVAAASVTTAAAATKPKRGRKTTQTDPADVGGDIVRSKRGSRMGAAAAAAAPAGADDDPDPSAAAAAKLKRGSRKKTAAINSTDNDSDQAAAAAVVDTPAKPVRRTKKLIAAEVAEAARQGLFNELTSLSGTYSHVAMFQNDSTKHAWQQLLSETAAAVAEVAAAAGIGVGPGRKEPSRNVVDSTATAVVAAAAARKGDQITVGSAVEDREQVENISPQQQQHQQQQCIETSQGVLCRTSGLGAKRQQLWLHNVTHDSAMLSQATQSYVDWKEIEMQRQEAEEAAAAAAAAAAVEEDQSQEQQKGKKKQKTPKKQQERRYKRSDSTTPYGQGVLSSQPSATALVEIGSPAAAAAAAIDTAAAAAEVAAADKNGSTPLTAAAAANGSVASTPAAAAGSPETRLLPNLGYACLCMQMRQFEIFNSRDCVKKTRDGPDGLAKVSQLALANARDLLPLILWNEAHGIRFFRLSSCILPWMTSYETEELPDWPDIQKALREAGDAAKRLGHRLTFHPSEYCKIAGERADWITHSVKELEVHSRIFDEMGFLPASPYNKINIHVGGTYGGEKEPVLRRFAQVVNERLTPNCKARMTVENDDRANMYSAKDLMLVHELTGIPIVFDFHHWKFCTGGQSQEEAFRLALTTWPEGIRPVVHWSESPEDPDKMRSAHSDYIDGPINLFGLEGQVDVMIESKAKELALLEYRQAVIEGWTIRPKQRNAELAAQAAVVKAATDAAKAEAKAAKLAEKGLEEADDGDANSEKVETGARIEGTPSKGGRTARRQASGVSGRNNKSGTRSAGKKKRKAKQDSDLGDSDEPDLSGDDESDSDE